MADADPKLVEKRSVPLMLIYSDPMFPLADLGVAMETIAILFFAKGRLREKSRIENFQATEGSGHLLMKFGPAEFRFNSFEGFQKRPTSFPSVFGWYEIHRRISRYLDPNHVLKSAFKRIADEYNRADEPVRKRSTAKRRRCPAGPVLEAQAQAAVC
jgi:hypothetical protein